MSQDVEETMRTVMEQIQEEKEEHIVLRGDYNARTGNEGGSIKENEKKARATRNSKDKVVYKEGRILINKIEERGWQILNGSFDKEGGWTYIGEAGASVVDYVIVNEKAEENIRWMNESDRTDTDYVLKVEVEGPEVQAGKRKEKTKVVKRSDWSEEGITIYRVSCEKWTCEQIENEEI